MDVALDRIDMLADSFLTRPGVPVFVYALLAAVLIGALAWASWVDLRKQILPNYITVTGIVAAAALAPVLWEDPVRHWAFGVGVFCFFFALTFYKGGEGFGMGDAKLYALAGFLLGQGVVVCVVVAGLIGSLQGLAMLVRHGKEARTMRIPHGPHIVVGILTVLAIAVFS